MIRTRIFAPPHIMAICRALRADKNWTPIRSAWKVPKRTWSQLCHQRAFPEFWNCHAFDASLATPYITACNAQVERLRDAAEHAEHNGHEQAAQDYLRQTECWAAPFTPVRVRKWTKAPKYACGEMVMVRSRIDDLFYMAFTYKCYLSNGKLNPDMSRACLVRADGKVCSASDIETVDDFKRRIERLKHEREQT